jgi:hypothetical protein
MHNINRGIPFLWDRESFPRILRIVPEKNFERASVGVGLPMLMDVGDV